MKDNMAMMKKADIYYVFGKRTKEIREKLGLSQESLAFKAGISPGFMSHIELGSKKASLETVAKVADALGVQPGDLIGPPAKASGYTQTEEDLFARRIALLVKDKDEDGKKLLVQVAKYVAEK